MVSVGYGVCKSRRGQGIASLMLQEAKAFLKEIGVDKVLMTTNPKNVASQKVIKHSGGYEIESYVKRMEIWSVGLKFLMIEG